MKPDRSCPVHDVVEVCAGAGGQALGLEAAGFSHRIAVEVDGPACSTLRLNRPQWHVAEGDATSRLTWDPARYRGASLLAAGVPCQPYTIAGKQLGAADDRDMLSWTVDLVETLRPRAVLLENVPGLSQARFAAYRQHILTRLAGFGYAADWRKLNACDYGVPQLRPRFVLVAMRPQDFRYFAWPPPQGPPLPAARALQGLMAANGWPGAAAWAAAAGDAVAPTIVGGSKKHGGPDLGPTRAKRAWLALGVDATGIADDAPPATAAAGHLPRLTLPMVARIQGFDDHQYPWVFTGRKTPQYRQIGNAFPPPVARALGEQILRAFSSQEHTPPARPAAAIHDLVYSVLRADGGFLTAQQIRGRAGEPIDDAALRRRLASLQRDFELDTQLLGRAVGYRLGALRNPPPRSPRPEPRPYRRQPAGSGASAPGAGQAG